MGPTIYFADASFWIALLSKRDEHHSRCGQWRRYLLKAQSCLLTTQAVLWEMLNSLSAQTVRAQAAEVYRASFQDSLIEVVGFGDADVEASYSQILWTAAAA